MGGGIRQEGGVVHRRHSEVPARGGRQELDAVLGLQIRWPLTLQSPSDGGGAWTGQQRRRCGDRLAADGSEWMICGSRRQRWGCPSRCVIGG